MSLAVPPRWLHCPRRGSVLQDSWLVPFKTPLDDRYDALVPAECQFTPEMLIESCLSHHCPLGLVIDLTKTSRYYDVGIFERAGIKHHKLPCVGHGQVPPPELVQEFLDVCAAFLDERTGKFIGVHCTHGFNRTGFMICSFLVVYGKWDIHAAVSEFARCRPPGIYKDHYLREIYQIFRGDGGLIRYPGQPDWDSHDSSASDGEDADNEPSAEMPPPKRSRRKSSDAAENEAKNAPAASFSSENDGIESMPGLQNVGVRIRGTQLEELRTQCNAWCKWDGKPTEFPGSQPVSLTKELFDQFLKQKPYRVSWKADGIRYLMMIRNKEVYMFDRAYRCFHIPNMRFPQRKNLHDPIHQALVDGELVIDKVEKGGERPRFLMYDFIWFEGHPIGRDIKHYPSRLKALEVELHAPRIKAQIDTSKDPFSIRVKEFFSIAEFHICRDLSSKLSHETDGFIFQQEEMAYSPGRTMSLLKWKNPEKNTVDFKAKIVKLKREGCPTETVCQLLLLSGGSLDNWGTLHAEIPLTKSLDGKIIECLYRNGQWEFHRIREDKELPNAVQTAEGVRQSIVDGITVDHLEEFSRSFAEFMERQRRGAAPAPAPAPQVTAKTTGSSITTIP